MHLYFITRGIKNFVDVFLMDLQCQKFPMTYQGQNISVQGALRPIQLWEYVIPEPCLPIMMKSLCPQGVENLGDKYKKMAWALKKTLKVDKFPEFDLAQVVPRELLYSSVVGVVPIGIKKDKYNEHGEML